MVIVDEEDCYKWEDCQCCGCNEDQECCCNFIYSIDTRYYNQQQHDLKVELVSSDCANITSLTGVMKPEPTTPTDPDFCGVRWVTSAPGGFTDFIDYGGGCASLPAGTKVAYELYCLTGTAPSTDVSYDNANTCNNGYGWRLRVRYDNSACTGIPNSKTEAITESSTYGPLYKVFGEPVCDGVSGFDNTTACPPNFGTFEVQFRLDAPYPRDGVPAGQCDCCSQGDYYIIKISLNQTDAPTPTKPFGTTTHPYCTPPFP